MLYESEAGDITMALTGDFMITRRLRVFREPRFLELVEILRAADLTFSNLEMLVHRWEGAPGYQHGTFTASDPRNLEELRWMGIDVVSCANNHSYDYTERGLLANLENLENYDIPHAGTGRDLHEAMLPAYVETPKGRVALISATSTFHEASRAASGRPGMHGRPGVNALGHQAVYTVEPDAFEALRRMGRALGMEAEKEYLRRFGFRGPMPVDTDTEFHFLGGKFVLGEEYRASSVPNKEDMERNLTWVRDARRQADWVLMSLHNHEYGRTREEPAHFVVEFAHACVDAGADVFIGHGPHFDRGVEVYKGKPILYALGNFVFQNDTVQRLPRDAYARFGLGHEATPADFFEARSAKDTRAYPADPIHWRTVCASVEFRGGKLKEVRLHPVDVGFKKPRAQRGRPLLADGEVQAAALDQLRRLSKPFGTTIEVRDGVGLIRP